MCAMERMAYRYRNADIETWSMIFEVYTQKVGIDGVTDIGRDEEGVRKDLVEEIWTTQRALD